MSISTSLRWLLLPLLALPVANGSSAPQAAPVADAAPAPAAAATTPPPAAATAVPVWSGASWPWQRASTLAQLWALPRRRRCCRRFRTCASTSTTR